MTNEETIRKMNAMKLTAMARAFTQALQNKTGGNFTTDELIGGMIDAEWDDRHNRKLKRLLYFAKLRYPVSFEQIDFDSQRNLNKNSMLRFSNCHWIPKGESILITGPTGVGKSFLACALGNLACLNGFSVLYFNCVKLLTQLTLAKADGSYTRLINRIEKAQLLILDDFGLEPLERSTRLNLLEILEDRHARKSTIISSQLPSGKWHDVIGDATIADAICDRLVHSAHKISLKGDSLRKKYAQKLDQ